MNQFKVIEAEVITGMSADYITHVTNIKHPGYKDKTLRITARVTPKTGQQWIRDTFGVEAHEKR